FHPGRLPGAGFCGGGWGLWGVCPGAGLASLGLGNWPMLLAIVTMLLGACIHGIRVEGRRSLR
ncbi:MAG: YeeE/YedE family protein, partial [Cyanobacteriota bacterium]